MGELAAQDQILLLQLTHRPLAGHFNAALQHLEGPFEIVEALAPADIYIGHGVRLGSKETQGRTLPYPFLLSLRVATSPLNLSPAD